MMEERHISRGLPTALVYAVVAITVVGESGE